MVLRLITPVQTRGCHADTCARRLRHKAQQTNTGRLFYDLIRRSRVEEKIKKVTVARDKQSDSDGLTDPLLVCTCFAGLHMVSAMSTDLASSYRSDAVDSWYADADGKGVVLSSVHHVPWPMFRTSYPCGKLRLINVLLQRLGHHSDGLQYAGIR